MSRVFSTRPETTIDHKPLTDEELQIIRQRHQAASAQPLAVINEGSGRVALYLTAGAADKTHRVATYYGPNRVADAHFAAHANQDMRRVLAEMEHLRALLIGHHIPVASRPRAAGR